MRTLGACLLWLVTLAGCCTCCGERGGYGPAPGPASQVLSQERRTATEAERRALVASADTRIQNQLETSGGKPKAAEQQVEYVDSAPSTIYRR